MELGCIALVTCTVWLSWAPCCHRSAQVAHDNLQTVQRGAGKLVGRRRRETVESSMGEFERQAEAAATAARYNATRVMA